MKQNEVRKGGYLKKATFEQGYEEIWGFKETLSRFELFY